MWKELATFQFFHDCLLSFLEKLLGSVYICVLISVRHCHQMVSERNFLARVNVLSPWVMHITLAVPLFPSMCINGY